MQADDHATTRDALFAYLDGDMNSTERLAVERHLAECESCRLELDVTRAANQVFAQVPQQPLPAGFYDRLKEKLAQSGTAPPVNGAATQLPIKAPSVVPMGATPAALTPPAVEPPPLTVASPAVPPVVPRPAVATLARPATSHRSYTWRAVMGVAAALIIVLGGLMLLRPQDNGSLAQSPVVLAYAEGGQQMVNGVAVQETVAVNNGDTLQTGTGSRAIVTLPDDSSLRLGPQTTVRVVALASGDHGTTLQLELSSGQLWVQEAGNTRCTVKTPDAPLTPVGTVFDATVTDGHSQVAVYDGQVDLIEPGPNDKPVHLLGGHQATLSGANNAVTLSQIKDQLNTPWVQWNRNTEPTTPSHHMVLTAAPRLATRTPGEPSWVRSPAPLPNLQTSIAVTPTPAATHAPAPAIVRHAAPVHAAAAAPTHSVTPALQSHRITVTTIPAPHVTPGPSVRTFNQNVNTHPASQTHPEGTEPGRRSARQRALQRERVRQALRNWKNRQEQRADRRDGRQHPIPPREWTGPKGRRWRR